MIRRASAETKQAMKAAKLVSQVGVRDEDDWRDRVHFATAVLADIEALAQAGPESAAGVRVSPPERPAPG